MSKVQSGHRLKIVKENFGTVQQCALYLQVKLAQVNKAAMHLNMAVIEIKLSTNVSYVYYSHSLENNSHLNILNEANKQKFRFYCYTFAHFV